MRDYCSGVLILEPLPLNALQGDGRTASVVGAVAFAVIVAELKLGCIAMQVPLGAVLIDAIHATLEDAEISLGGIRVDLAADVLARAVGDEIVIGEDSAQATVLARLVRVDRGLLSDVLAQDQG